MGPQAQFVWDGLHFRTPTMLAIVERMTDEQLLWQPPNGANPIAWMLWHIPEVEDNWVRDRLYGLPKRYPFGASVKSTPIHQCPRKPDLLGYFPDIFTAVQEQLGLKFVSEQEDQPVLVIDHVEHPTPE